MKLEKLSENQIRCTLNKYDLIDRELKISELAYGTEKAKGLFRDMMNQAFNEFGFEAEDIPLIIEAIPVSGDCIILIVTKVEDPEELDTRFAKFSELAEEFMEDDDENDELEVIEDSDIEDYTQTEDILDLFKRISDGLYTPEGKERKVISARKGNPASEGNGKNSKYMPSRVFSFKNLNEVSALAQVLHTEYTGKNTLYKNERTGVFYLVLNRMEDAPEQYNYFCNLITEYGRREKATYATIAYYEEHYTVIIRDKAISVLASL